MSCTIVKKLQVLWGSERRLLITRILHSTSGFVGFHIYFGKAPYGFAEIRGRNALAMPVETVS